MVDYLGTSAKLNGNNTLTFQGQSRREKYMLGRKLRGILWNLGETLNIHCVPFLLIRILHKVCLSMVRMIWKYIIRTETEAQRSYKASQSQIPSWVAKILEISDSKGHIKVLTLPVAEDVWRGMAWQYFSLGI